MGCLLDLITTPPEESSRGSRCFWISLYLAGAIGWILFYRAGDSSGVCYHAADWPKEHKYFSVLQQAIQTWAIPWHTSAPLQPSQPTDRFLAIPETLSLLTPQVQFLRWMPIKDFFLLNWLVMYTVGTAGWYVLARRYRFPPLVSVFGFVLFAFNGYIVAHLAAGHTMWSAYYWLPWFILLVLKACECPMTPRDAALLALVLGGMVLQGGCHLYIWCLIFLGGFAVTHPLRHRMVIVAAALSGLLAAHRFIPAAMEFNTNVHRLVGFDSVRALGAAMGSMRVHTKTIFPWEFDYYISRMGIIGILLPLAAAALVSPCRRLMRRYWPLLLPSALLTMLSFGKAPYYLLAYLPVPLLGTQRVPSRLAILPLLVALVIACLAATSLLTITREGWRRAIGAAGALAVGLLVWQVGQHAIIWRLAAMEAKDAYRLMTAANLAPTLVTKADPVYVAVVWGSLAISLVALCGIAVVLMRTHSATAEERG